ncbi:MAG TPA: hypothetical protein VFA81_12335, partial [Burkholderiales bacterium]|nr:hypothetical protein [Burkholderiales bacterium]
MSLLLNALQSAARERPLPSQVPHETSGEVHDQTAESKELGLVDDASTEEQNRIDVPGQNTRIEPSITATPPFTDPSAISSPPPSSIIAPDRRVKLDALRRRPLNWIVPIASLAAIGYAAYLYIPLLMPSWHTNPAAPISVAANTRGAAAPLRIDEATPLTSTAAGDAVRSPPSVNPTARVDPTSLASAPAPARPSRPPVAEALVAANSSTKGASERPVSELPEPSRNAEAALWAPVLSEDAAGRNDVLTAPKAADQVARSGEDAVEPKHVPKAFAPQPSILRSERDQGGTVRDLKVAWETLEQGRYEEAEALYTNVARSEP